MSSIKTGIAVVKMYLPLGLKMAGYIKRTRGAEGIHDALQIKAACFISEDTKALIISCDLLGLSQEFTRKASDALEKRLGIPAANIIICCTHTHSAPGTMRLKASEHEQNRWLINLGREMEECAVEAFNQAEGCDLFVYRSLSDISSNRVLKQNWGGRNTENWEIRNWDELDPLMFQAGQQSERGDIHTGSFTDREVVILEIRNKAKKACGFLVNFACHAVTLEYENYLYSADFPYYMEQKIQQIFPGTPVFFLNGCCGDINPVNRGGYGVAKILGERLAGIVIDSFSEIGIKLSGMMRVSAQRFEVPLDAVADESELSRRAAIYKRGLTQAKRTGQYNDALVYGAYLDWANAMQRRLRDGFMKYSTDADLRVIRIGSLSIVALPFEIFHEIGLAAKARLGGITMIIAYANGYNGYLISENMYPYAKYERFESYKFTQMPGPIAKEAGKILLDRLKYMEKQKIESGKFLRGTSK